MDDRTFFVFFSSPLRPSLPFFSPLTLTPIIIMIIPYSTVFFIKNR